MSKNDCVFLISIILSFAVIVISAINSIKKKNQGKTAIKSQNLILYSVLIVFFLIFPQYFLNSKNSCITSIVFSALYSLKTISCGQDWKLCREIFPGNNILYYLYYSLLYIDFIIVPFFTMSFLISLFGNFTDKIRLKFIRKNKVFVFSDLNENSVSLAKSICKGKNERIIFCNCSQGVLKDKKALYDQARELKAIFFESSSSVLTLRHSIKEIIFFEISSDKSQNLENTIKLIEKYSSIKNKEKIKIKTFAASRIAEVLLDSIKNDLTVELIDEIKYSCYQLLYDYPLFMNVNKADNKKISALVIGGGRTGLEFVKSISWCGQLNDYSLEINVVDYDSELKSKFNLECPDLTKENGYNINFYCADVNSNKFKDIVYENCSDTSYVVVCTGNDNLNIKTAIKVREMFMAMQCHKSISVSNEMPVINARIRNDQKNRIISDLSSKNVNYNINAFGTIIQIFNAANLNNNYINLMSQYVHAAYSINPNETLMDISSERLKKILESYRKNIYNQRSSLACAIHIKYKFFELMGSDNMFNMDSVEKLRKRLCDKKTLEDIVIMEHNRSNAYMRSEGYCCSTVDEVKNYYSFTGGDYRFHIAKLHPTIVEWEELSNTYQVLKEIKPDLGDITQSDYRICLAIPDILEIIKEKNNELES